jgi:hypothetical protein
MSNQSSTGFTNASNSVDRPISDSNGFGRSANSTMNPAFTGFGRPVDPAPNGFDRPAFNGFGRPAPSSFTGFGRPVDPASTEQTRPAPSSFTGFGRPVDPASTEQTRPAPSSFTGFGRPVDPASTEQTRPAPHYAFGTSYYARPTPPTVRGDGINFNDDDSLTELQNDYGNPINYNVSITNLEYERLIDNDCKLKKTFLELNVYKKIYKLKCDEIKNTNCLLGSNVERLVLLENELEDTKRKLSDQLVSNSELEDTKRKLSEHLKRKTIVKTSD